MSQIKQIKQVKIDNTIYDLHDAKAVHSVNGQSPDASGNVSVTAELPDGLVKYNSLSTVEAVTPLNADTLENHPASYFATASDMSALRTNVSTLQTNVSTLQTNVSTNTSNIATNTGNITSLQTSVSSKVSKSGDTMTGALVAQNNTNYTIKQVRNIIISTEDPSGGDNGDIWIKYAE